MTGGILDGVRVVELGGGHAAAVAAMLFADAGADVVKVEGPEGKEARQSASFAVWNRGKQSVLLDWSDRDCSIELEHLLAHADVVITDWLPSVQRARGVDEASLRARFPTLVHTAIGGWPAGHPLEERAVDDTLVLAEAGILDEQVGYRDGPIYLRFPLGSWGAAYLAAIGSLARHIARGRDGCGGTVRTSLLQGALLPTAMLWRRAEHGSPAFETSMDKTMRTPQFECADGVWIHVKAPPDDAPLMRAALDALGPERVAELNVGHPSNHTCINWGANAHIFRTRPSGEWLEDLWASDVPVQADVPLGRIYFDEQGAANGYVVAVDDPVFGKTRQPGPPVSVAPPMVPQGPAPLLGSAVATVWEAGAAMQANKAVEGAALPLTGLKVADFGAYLAGPLATMLLADLGAEVVKIETPAGDVMRRVPGAFVGCQRGKRSLALDLKGKRAREVTGAIAKWADVVHHNIRMPAAVRLGLDYATLAAVNPNLVFAHVSSYGPLGPRKDWPGYDQLFQAQTGWEYEGAGEGNPPMWHRFGMMDHQAALASVFGTLLGLYHRDRGGGGQAVAASLLGASLLTVSETVVGPDGKLTPFQRLDARQLGVGAGRRLYRTCDGWVAVVSEAPGALARLQRMTGAATTEQLDAALDRLGCAEAIRVVESAGGRAVIAHPNWRDPFFDDPANRSAALVKEYDHPTLGRLEMLGAFLEVDGVPAVANRAPPEIGESSQSVLRELGFAANDIDTMIAGGFVAQFRTADVPREPAQRERSVG